MRVAKILASRGTRSRVVDHCRYRIEPTRVTFKLFKAGTSAARRVARMALRACNCAWCAVSPTPTPPASLPPAPTGRASVPSASLVELAGADAFLCSLKFARGEALWAIKALRDEPLPLFAAAAVRALEAVPEIREPVVSLKPMTTGGEVVEDYGHVGLTLRAHPLSFLRQELRAKRIVTCAEAMAARDGRWLEAAGRPRPAAARFSQGRDVHHDRR